MSSLARWTLRRADAKAFQRSCRQSTLSRPSRHARTFSITQYSQRERDDDVGDVEINYFEQDVVPTEDKKGFKSVGKPRNIQRRIQQLEKELESLRGRSPFESEEVPESGNVPSDLVDLLPGMQDGPEAGAGVLPPEQMKQKRRSTARASPDTRLEVDLRLPEEQLKSLQNLNSALREASNDPDGDSSARQLWKRYMTSKKEVTGLLHHMPETAWRVLWESQYNSQILRDARSQRLWMLADDLSQAGQALTPIQRLVRIEGRLASNRIHEAMSMWDQDYEQLKKDADLAGSFLPLGVKIRIEADQMGEASQLAAKLARDQPSVAISCFLPLIESYILSSTDEGIQKAVNAYFVTRVALGNLITLEDFDRLTLCFLRNGQPDLAIGVFKDMISAECKSTHEATILRQKSLRVFDSFQSSGQDLAESSNERALNLLRFLPRQFQNKYFYASWLKRLIGLNELEAAEQVLELMFHRGVRPDAKHLNGLMSAWLRRDTLQGRNTALQLGEAMIRKRLDIVKDRQGDGGLPTPSKQPVLEISAATPLADRNVPPATIETFSILLLHYVRSNMKSSMTHLLTTLHLAGLEPNIFFTNHVLLAHKRAGDAAAAWDLFGATKKNGLRPDMDTFIILWDICKSHCEGHSPGRSQRFPSPRALFGHMSASLSALPSKERAEALASMTPETYLQIIRCFSLAQDLRGTLVALYALRDIFRLYPDMRAARLVTMQVARLGSPKRSQRMRLHDGHVTRKRQSVKIRQQASQLHFEQALQVLDLLKQEREADLAALGVTPADLTATQRGEEVLWLLAEFLRRTLVRAEDLPRPSDESGGESHAVTEAGSATPHSPSVRLEQVAFEMGVSVASVAPPAMNCPPD